MLNFRQDNMEQTIRKLENWYGVEIKVDTSGVPDKAWNYTGKYDNEPLDRVLEGIGFVKDFTHQRTGNQVKIVFHRAKLSGHVNAKATFSQHYDNNTGVILSLKTAELQETAL